MKLLANLTMSQSPSPIPDTFLKKEYTQFQGLFVLDEEPKDKDESSKVSNSDSCPYIDIVTMNPN